MNDAVKSLTGFLKAHVWCSFLWNCYCLVLVGTLIGYCRTRQNMYLLVAITFVNCIWGPSTQNFPNCSAGANSTKHSKRQLHPIHSISDDHSPALCHKLLHSFLDHVNWGRHRQLANLDRLQWSGHGPTIGLTIIKCIRYPLLVLRGLLKKHLQVSLAILGCEFFIQ